MELKLGVNESVAAPPVEVHRHTPEKPWTYALLDQRQREIAQKITEKGEKGVLLLSELAPVITLGRRAKREHLLCSEAELSQRGILIYPTDRGGLETYHGPGQWVLFAVERLDRMTGDPRGIKKAVQALLKVALEVGKLYAPEAEIREGAQLGVWSPQGKFASVGVHEVGGVLLHGLSVNGFKTETSFLGLKPCGLEAPVDFLLKNESGDRNAAFDRLGRELCRLALEHWFGPLEKPRPFGA